MRDHRRVVEIRAGHRGRNDVVGSARGLTTFRRLLGLTITATALTLVATGCTASGPAPKPSSTPSVSKTSSAVVVARLKNEVWARLPAGSRTAPALTWDDTRATSSGDSVDLSGDKRLLLAAACEGDGSVTVTVTGRRNTVLACRAGATAGPIDLTPVGDPPGSVEFDVQVASGEPQYFAAAVASSPSRSARP